MADYTHGFHDTPLDGFEPEIEHAIRWQRLQLLYKANRLPNIRPPAPSNVTFSTTSKAELDRARKEALSSAKKKIVITIK